MIFFSLKVQVNFILHLFHFIAVQMTPMKDGALAFMEHHEFMMLKLGSY